MSTAAQHVNVMISLQVLHHQINVLVLYTKLSPTNVIIGLHHNFHITVSDQLANTQSLVNRFCPYSS